MNVTKLPSGSYRVRKMIDGKNYSVTFDHKPTNKEVDDALFELRKNSTEVLSKESFKKCARHVIDSKANVLSPSTIKGYESILKNLSDAFLTARIDQISALDIQAEVNTYAATRSPKSVNNASTFINSVMWAYRPDMRIKTKLPQRKKPQVMIPTDEAVKKTIEAIKGSTFEAVILLACAGLRRSEAIAVTADDVKKKGKDYYLSINKATVAATKGYVEKDTNKSSAGTRTIWIPPYLAKLIIKQGRAYTLTSLSAPLRYLHKTQKRLGIPQTNLHAMRHYYISHAHELGVPDATIAKTVGHSNIRTTQSNYTHANAVNQTDYEKKASLI